MQDNPDENFESEYDGGRDGTARWEYAYDHCQLYPTLSESILSADFCMTEFRQHLLAKFFYLGGLYVQKKFGRLSTRNLANF